MNAIGSLDWRLQPVSERLQLLRRPAKASIPKMFRMTDSPT